MGCLHGVAQHPAVSAQLPASPSHHVAHVLTLIRVQVFLLLVAEMAIFMALIVPLPFTWRRKLFTFISENPIIAKLQYGMKITFIFILILFIDSVNRVYRVQVELSAFSKTDNQRGYVHRDTDSSTVPQTTSRQAS
jgi:hypothetical protein